MSNLIQEFEGKKLDEWAQWYQKKHPDAIKAAVKLIKAKLQVYREVIDTTTDEQIEDWVKDLVLTKTFLGLKSQEAILRTVASELNLEFRLATPEEEAKGIDGIIGKTAVSVKPASYKSQVIQKEQLPAVVIYYDKDDNGNLVIECDEKSIR